MHQTPWPFCRTSFHIFLSSSSAFCQSRFIWHTSLPRMVEDVDSSVIKTELITSTVSPKGYLFHVFLTPVSRYCWRGPLLYFSIHTVLHSQSSHSLTPLILYLINVWALEIEAGAQCKEWVYFSSLIHSHFAPALNSSYTCLFSSLYSWLLPPSLQYH